jgi:hypothetical protein
VSVSGFERASRFDSLMLSRMATQKAAEHDSHAALDSVARLKASRVAGLIALAPRGASFRGSVESHTPYRNPKAFH